MVRKLLGVLEEWKVAKWHSNKSRSCPTTHHHWQSTEASTWVFFIRFTHRFIETNTLLGMEVIRSYTVVPPSLVKEKTDNLVTEGQRFYLMIKIYPDGALTTVLGKLKAGKSGPDLSFTVHTFQLTLSLASFCATDTLSHVCWLAGFFLRPV